MFAVKTIFGQGVYLLKVFYASVAIMYVICAVTGRQYRFMKKGEI